MKCLIKIGDGIFKSKVYVPGETRENEKIRQYFIQKGGLASLLLLQKKSMDFFIKEHESLKDFLDNLPLND